MSRSFSQCLASSPIFSSSVTLFTGYYLSSPRTHGLLAFCLQQYQVQVNKSNRHPRKHDAHRRLTCFQRDRQERKKEIQPYILFSPASHSAPRLILCTVSHSRPSASIASSLSAQIRSTSTLTISGQTSDPVTAENRDTNSPFSDFRLTHFLFTSQLCLHCELHSRLDSSPSLNIKHQRPNRTSPSSFATSGFLVYHRRLFFNFIFYLAACRLLQTLRIHHRKGSLTISSQPRLGCPLGHHGDRQQ